MKKSNLFSVNENNKSSSAAFQNSIEVKRPRVQFHNRKSKLFNDATAIENRMGATQTYKSNMFHSLAANEDTS